jgi:hypothetical protein
VKLVIARCYLAGFDPLRRTVSRLTGNAGTGRNGLRVRMRLD